MIKEKIMTTTEGTNKKEEPINAHGDSTEAINSQISKEQKELNYNEVYDDALNIDYNEEKKIKIFDED
ncbi:hypothetical protein PIROE2DRAFT_3302 [Piromyces sp. E2]|nr:hypothetical protein PIROE2DRAFT_3302 [Piromyces sp. E2]|eukprot:OUM68911.1 hypothetical protein PIROE2DRAFT_3302 [Piromyces sp. E2]